MDMRIVECKTWSEDMQLSRPYAVAGELCSEAFNCFIGIRTDNGLMGLGAGSPSPRVTGETLEAADCALSLVAESVVGQDPLQLNELCSALEPQMPGVPAARAAVDMALHDLFAQAQGKPLVECLGRVHAALPTSVTIGIQSLDRSLAEADEYLALGFRIIKLKIGDDVEADIEISQRICERLGETVVLRVDGNQGYDTADLQRFLTRTRELKLEFIEQPLPRGRIPEMRALPGDIRYRCAADEDLHTPGDARQLIQEPMAFGIFNIKLMKCGGVHPALRIAALAESADIELMWGCMDESRISIAAALHAALACPATRYLDLDGSLDLAHDIVSGGFTLHDGCLDVIDAPGLGLVLIEDRP